MEIRYSPVATTLEASESPSPRIVGYAAIFNSLSEEMPVRASEPHGRKFREIIRPGAFAASLVGQRAIFANLQHDQTAILGSTASGTLRLTEDNRGLRYEITPPNTQTGRDAVELIRRGDVAMSSFGFSVRDGGETWRSERGSTIRELRSLILYDVSPVTMAAYVATDVALRSLAEWERSGGSGNTMMQMRLELAERW